MQKHIASLLTFVAATALAASPFTALAQSSDVQAARDAAKTQIEKVVPSSAANKAAPSLQKAALSAAPVETLETRIAAALSIADLAMAETKDALGKTKLAKIAVSTDSSLASIAKTFIPRVRAYQAYAGLVHDQLSQPALTDEQLKQIAGSLKQWYEGVYGPGMRQVLNLAMVDQGGEVLSTATKRFEKVIADVAMLQRVLGNDAKQLGTGLEAARGYLASAQDSYTKARTTLLAEQKDFLKNENTKAPGVPAVMTFERGPSGEFVCAPAKEGVKGCAAAYKTAQGTYYLLLDLDEMRAKDLGEIYRVTGAAVTLSPAFTDDLIVGVLFVEHVNLARIPDGESEIAIDGTANLLAAAGIKAASPNIAALIKDEVESIKKMYQELFDMVSLAKKLRSQ